jgi:spore coat-associated protein N
MSIKKKLGLGIGAAALGLSLIGGGTFSYFSDTAVQASTFSSGTLDLTVNPTANVEFKDIAPGDYIPRAFKLVNNGSIDIKKVNLKTEYRVTKNGEVVTPELAEKYAEAIEVTFLRNTGDTFDGEYEMITKKTLKQLKTMNPDDLAKEYEATALWALRDGIKAKGSGQESTDDFRVQFTFKDSKADQNDLQGLKLSLDWTFEGVQRDGMQK